MTGPDELAALPDLVVVANRLPVQRASDDGHWETSPGGLVRALMGTLRQGGGAWVGWAGSVGAAPEPFEHEGVDLLPLSLSLEEYEGFYEGFANEALWPLYHDGIRPSTFDPAWWETYVQVNQRFAEAAAEIAAPGAIVWVHDYQLQLVPSMLRALRPDVRIGFFLHIPFPPLELFSRLPWREQILEGLLGADVLGFQRQAAVENFAAAAARFLDVQGDLPWLKVGPRKVHAGAHPISIDVQELDDIARRPVTVEQAWKLRNRLGSPKCVLLGVDRLDYTKGIVERLRAFERLLEDGRIKARDCVMVQLAVPTRGRLEHYAEEKRQVEQLVGSINGDYGRIGFPAVHYLHQALTLEELVPLYKAADVMLVTPLGDGMNLVAKEFAASRTDGEGVLVLSEFAGAADELTDALVVNPHDQAALSDTIYAAVEMPSDEVRARMAAIRATVEASDVHHWASGFLDLLGEGDAAHHQEEPPWVGPSAA
jgi:trehalose 6-phosphate synthase